MKISELLKTKSEPLEVIEASASLREAARRFIADDARTLIVTEGERVVGLVAMRDLLRALHDAPDAGAAFEAEVRSAMSRELVTVTPETSLEDAENEIVSHRINELPVVDEGKLVAVFSLADILGMHLGEASGLNADLRTYLRGPHVM